MRLTRSFYTNSALQVAQDLLGCFLVRKIGRKKLIGKIVETEAYLGPEDKASHAYKGKMTERNRVEFWKGGYVYIYLVYGIYWQLNITTGLAGSPECVLIRALEPWVVFRGSLPSASSRVVLLRSFLPVRASEDSLAMTDRLAMTDGPGKLCRWLKLDKSFYGEDLCKSKKLWLESRIEKISSRQIIKAKRIGIDYAQEYADKLWRFYLKDNKFVSKC